MKQRTRQTRPSLLTSLPDVDIVASQNELIQHVDTLIRRLSYRQRTILKLFFGLGSSYGCVDFDQIGRIMQIGHWTVRNLLALALRKLRRSRSKLAQFL